MIESVLFWILIILFVFYASIYFLAWKGLRKFPSPVEGSPAFSIIVAARNEERNIQACLESLTQLEYPSDRFEVIVVSDRSTDTTPDIVRSYAQKFSNVKLIEVTTNNSGVPHKKNALMQGITNAKNEILAFTDADCIVPRNWLKELAGQFSVDVGLVAGYSPYNFENPKSFAATFLRYEEVKNSLGAASGIGLSSAYMCTGRNLAYRKKVFDEVGGFKEINQSISGDDDLFIQLVQRKTTWDIRYMISPESYVSTQPPSSFSQVINQRTRHFSASKYYPANMKFIFGTVHLFNFLIFVSLYFLPLHALILLMAKCDADAILIARGKEVFHEEFSTPEFFVNEILYMVYNIVIGPLGLFKKFDWKGSAA